MRNNEGMFRSMISSSRITTLRSLPSSSISLGSSTILEITEGTCTMANSSSSSSPLFFLKSAAMFSVLFRISGKGLEESKAMGVRTGYTFFLKYSSVYAASSSVISSCPVIMRSPFCLRVGTRERL